MGRGPKVLLCGLGIISAFLLLTPSAKLTISYGALLHTGDVVPYGINSTLMNLRPYPLSSDSFACGWIKIWNAKGELIADQLLDTYIPLCYAGPRNPSAGPAGDIDMHTFMIGPFQTETTFGSYLLADYIHPFPLSGTYTIQVKRGDATSNKLTITFPQTHKAN